jgi:hypothetical protein
MKMPQRRHDHRQGATMTWTSSTKMLFILLFLVLFLGGPAYAIEISNSVSTNGAGMSEHLDLDDSTSYDGSTILSGDNIFDTHIAKGSGINSIQDTLSGQKYTITNTIISSGTFNTAAAIVASSSSAVYKQNTNVEGDAGYVSTDAISANNEMQAAAEFQGSGGSIKANLFTGANENAALIGGEADINSVECYNDQVSDIVSSGYLGRSVDAIYRTNDGVIGNSGFSVMNEQTSSPYALMGYRWNTDSRFPMIQLYLRYDTVPTNLKSSTRLEQAITTAARLWDIETNQALFIPTVMIINNDKYSSDIEPDYKNTLAFSPQMNQNDIAYTQTWYSESEVGGYRSALDSDITYNSNVAWSFGGIPGSSSQPIDFQTITSHELGHTLGLGDLYDSDSSSQIMYGYYVYPKNILGNGDIAGIQKLYP